MSTRFHRLIVPIVLGLALVLCAAAVGQVLKGSISGTATDPQGAVIKDAKVKSTNTATLNERSTTTDSSGAFRFNLLPAGDYTIEISAPGFKTVQQTHITVIAGNDTGVGALKLEVGDTSTTIEVTAAAPLIESTQAQVTNTFSGVTLSAQPGVQANEGLDNIALFAPGVSSSRDNNFSNTNGGLGFAVNGIRGRNNDQQIDGQNNNDNSVAGPSLFVSDPEWATQYNLVTNNFGPEYGRNAGSVVNILTKQGGNQWHGSIYGYENNSVLNAMTNFQKNFDLDANGNPLTKPPRLNNEFAGVQLGGPWVKNRFFLSGGFNQQIISTSTPFASGGITPTPAGLVTLAACPGINAQALSALTAFGPFGVKGGNPVAQNLTTGVVNSCPAAEFGTVVRNLSTPVHSYDFYTRADIQLPHDTFVARYIYNRSNFFNLDPGAQGAASGYPFNEPALAQATLASWTHNFSARIVNELRVAYGRLNVQFGGNDIGNTTPTVNNLPNALTNVAFQSPTFLGFGPNTALPQGRFVNTWQGQDNLNWVLGKHTIKLGANWTYQQSPNTFLPVLNGAFLYPDWNAYFASTPFSVSVANGNTELGFKEYDTFAYAGDDWKVTRSLTLNLGLTWTYYGKPANLLNTLSVRQQLNPSTALWIPPPTLPLSVSSVPAIPGVYNAFGPSAGFAWAPQGGGMLTGHGKTVIRGGYRLSYDPPFYNIYLNVANSAPSVFLQTLTGGTAAAVQLPAVPTGPNVRGVLSPFLQKGVFDPQTFVQEALQPNLKPDQVSSWSFGIQREIGKSSAIEVRYVGNHALHLFQFVDSNAFLGTAANPGQFQLTPQFLPAGTGAPCPTTAQIGPGAGTDVGRTVCGPGVQGTVGNTGFSHYNAVQAEIRSNGMFQQLTMRAGYTYSKTSDNVSEIFNTFAAGNTLAIPQNPTQPVHGEYSFSGLDYPNTFYALVSEQIPFFKNQHGWVGHLLGGWGISANYIFQTGQRYTPAQVTGIAAATAAGNFYDSDFLAAFNAGIDSARPFVGNLSAPQTAVGIFAGDACALFSTGCALTPTQLISLNAINISGLAVPTTNNLVRFIVNGGTAQSIFGTPFGNMPRNIAQDARTNIGSLSVSKSFNIKERASFEFRVSSVNVLNHPNFQSIDPFVEDAGNFAQFNGFGNPKVSDTVPGAININASRNLIFGGVFRF